MWGFVIVVLIILALILVLEFVVLLYQYRKTDYYKQTGASIFKIGRDLGKLGEYYIYDKLKKLRGYKKWLFNCYIPKDNGETTELDVILLHESGMYIFESKNYSGWIFGTETQKDWTQTLPKGRGRSEKNHFYNPIMQNKGHLKWIKKYLGDTKIPIYSYIVFSERCTLKDITLTSNEHFVIKRDSILASVRKTAASAGEQLTASDIDALYEKLYPLTQLSEEQKRQHVENIQKNHSTGKMAEERKPALQESESTVSEQESETLARGQESETTMQAQELEITVPGQESETTVQGQELESTVPGQESETKLSDQKPETTVSGQKSETVVPSQEPVSPEQMPASSEQSSDAVTVDSRDNVEVVERICPRCGGKLVMRTSSKGVHKGNQFWGCSNYPKCRYIENVE